MTSRGWRLEATRLESLNFSSLTRSKQGCDTVITAGAAQSNHCRQTAAAAAALGLSCHLALGGSPPPVANGNLLLDKLFGATIHWSGALRKGEGLARIERELCSQGLRPFVIPYGGSNPLGAAGFVAAMIELDEQLEDSGARADAVVFASSSGGTHAGLLVGASTIKSSARIIGIGIDKREPDEEPFDAFIARLAGRTAELLGAETQFRASDVLLKTDYLGAGYGVVGDLEREAIRLMAEQEAILLDPVYTGRAFGALVDLIRRGEFASNEHVIFWHTGGVPALFSYAETLTECGGEAVSDSLGIKPRRARREISRSASREEKLKDLKIPGTKRAGASQEIVAPHAAEPLSIATLEAIPRTGEISFPGEKCFFVVRAKVLNIFENKELLCGSRYLRGGGQHRIGEDITCDPGVGVGARPISGDCLTENDPIVLQASRDNFHIVSVILRADVFEHANANDAIKPFLQVTVVLEPDFDGEAPARLGRITALLFGDRDPNNAAFIVFGSMLGQPTPSAADIQKIHPSL